MHIHSHCQRMTVFLWQKINVKERKKWKFLNFDYLLHCTDVLLIMGRYKIELFLNEFLFKRRKMSARKCKKWTRRKRERRKTNINRSVISKTTQVVDWTVSDRILFFETVEGFRAMKFLSWHRSAGVEWLRAYIIFTDKNRTRRTDRVRGLTFEFRWKWNRKWILNLGGCQTFVLSFYEYHPLSSSS